MDPTEQPTADFTSDYPFLAYDIASELARCGEASEALKYFELLRTLPGDPDATVPLQMGRCYLAIGEQSSAEECFLAAIEADEENIDARIELANMYEKAKEDEEALILAAEAMALREAQNRGEEGDHPGVGASRRGAAGQTKDRPPRRRAPRAPKASKDHVVPRRYRPKRLAGADKRRQDEQARAVKLSQQYQVVRDLRRQINEGREDLVPVWMASSKELVDDFRSLKKFYTWDKYLHFLGRKASLERPPPEQPQNELSLMYERLTRCELPFHGVLFRKDVADQLLPQLLRLASNRADGKVITLCSKAIKAFRLMTGSICSLIMPLAWPSSIGGRKHIKSVNQQRIRPCFSLRNMSLSFMLLGAVSL